MAKEHGALKVCRKGMTPDGTAIQIEDWSEVYPETRPLYCTSQNCRSVFPTLQAIYKVSQGLCACGQILECLSASMAVGEVKARAELLTGLRRERARDRPLTDRVGRERAGLGVNIRVDLAPDLTAKQLKAVRAEIESQGNKLW